MSGSPILGPTSCAICGTTKNATELYAANFSVRDLNPDIFSARRMPDRIHYRIVRCRSCGLARSDPTIDQVSLSQLYTQSSPRYDAEVPNLMETYARYLDRAVRCLAIHDAGEVRTRSLLEIGCGSGFFLEKALDQGFEKVMGIEPSWRAVEKSSPHIRENILCDVLRPGILRSEKFDIICMFQVFDHIPTPGSLLDECREALKPGGVILCLNHDIEAWSARLFGENSPIIDIEHTYLYSKGTIRRIFIDHGFAIRELDSVINIYSLAYIVQLLPLPKRSKGLMLSIFRRQSLGSISLPVRLGNLFLVAQKP